MSRTYALASYHQKGIIINRPVIVDCISNTKLSHLMNVQYRSKWSASCQLSKILFYSNQLILLSSPGMREFISWCSEVLSMHFFVWLSESNWAKINLILKLFNLRYTWMFIMDQIRVLHVSWRSLKIYVKSISFQFSSFYLLQRIN